jgi:hypothetical protein
MVRVGAGEPFTVLIKHGHLPMMVFSPCVFAERCAFPNFHLQEDITLNVLSTNEPLETHSTLTRCERGPVPGMPKRHIEADQFSTVAFTAWTPPLQP